MTPGQHQILAALTKPKTVDELTAELRYRFGSDRRPVYNFIYRNLRVLRGLGLVDLDSKGYRHVWSRTTVPEPRLHSQAELPFGNVLELLQ